MTNDELRVRVDEQVEEYDLSVSDAIENVSDELGLSYDETWKRYLAASGN